MFDPFKFKPDPFVQIFILEPRRKVRGGKCPLSDKEIKDIRNRAIHCRVNDIIFRDDEKSHVGGRYCLKIEARAVDDKPENVEISIWAAYAAGEAFCQIAMVDFSGVFIGASVSGEPFACVDEHAVALLPPDRNILCPCGWHVVHKSSVTEAIDEFSQGGTYFDYTVHPLAEL